MNMKHISTQLLGILLTVSSIVLILWFLPLVQSGFDWISLGAFSIVTAIAVLVLVSGIRILKGDKLSDVLSDLFTGLGK